MSTIFNEKVNITDTQLADNNDKVVAIGANGEIKETNKLVSDLSGSQDLDSVLTEGNTTNKDIVSTGDITTFISTAKVVNIESVDTTPVLNLKNGITSKNVAIRQGIQTESDVSLTLPIVDGKIALTSDNKDWLKITGSNSGSNLVVQMGEVGDQDLLFEINTLNREFVFTEGIIRSENGISSNFYKLGNGFNSGSILPPLLGFTSAVKQRIQDKEGTIALTNDRRHGFFDYNDTATATTPINVPGNSTFVYLTNNELGAFTNKLFPPDGVTDVYDASLNQFDFTQLPLGTKVDLRLDVEITTTGANQEIEIDIELAIGGFTYDLEVVREQYKSSGTYKLTVPTWVYMGDINTRDNPAKFKIKSDNNATVKVNGWACAIQLY